MPMFDFDCKVCGAHRREWRPDGRPPRYCSRKCQAIGQAGRAMRPVKWKITPEMDAAIRRVYQTATGDNQVKDLARRLGLPRWKVSRYAIAQGLIARHSKEPDWSEKELGILEHCAHLSSHRIQERLKQQGFTRSETGIVLKRRRMRYLKNLKGHSARDLARCLGVDEHCVTSAIKAGKLAAKKRGTDRTAAQGGDQWWIMDKAIRRYIIDYLPEIDIRKIDKYWFVDLLTRGRESGEGP